MEILDNTLYEIIEQINIIKYHHLDYQKQSLISSINNLTGKLNLMTLHLKIKIKFETILLELKQLLQNNQDLSYISISQPVLYNFEFLLPIKGNRIGANNYIWTKNLYFLSYYFSNNNEELYKINELINECVNDSKSLEKEDVIYPGQYKGSQNKFSDVDLYNFFEEYAMRMVKERKADFYNGRDYNPCFVARDTFEKYLRQRLSNKDNISIKFFNVFQKLKCNEMIFKETPSLFSERAINQEISMDWAPKKTILLSDINVKNMNNQFIQLELLGEFDQIIGKNCEIHLVWERNVIYNTPVQIQYKNRIEINISRLIHEASYLISIDSSQFTSNPILYNHHQLFPFAQKIKINECYKNCGSPIFNPNLIEYPKEFFWQKDFKQRNCLIIACLNENWHKVLQIIRNKNKLELNLNDSDDDGNTCLHYAAYYGNLDIVSEMLLLGCNPLSINRYGESPIFLSHKHDIVFSHLIKSCPKYPLLPSPFYWEKRDPTFYNKFVKEMSQIHPTHSTVPSLLIRKKENLNFSNNSIGNFLSNSNELDVCHNPINIFDKLKLSPPRDGLDDDQDSDKCNSSIEDYSSIEDVKNINTSPPSPKSRRSGSDSGFLEDKVSSEMRRFSTGDQNFEKGFGFMHNIHKPILTKNKNPFNPFQHTAPKLTHFMNHNIKKSSAPSISLTQKLNDGDANDCIEISKNFDNGSFKVDWVPEKLSVYQRWVKPSPVIQYDLETFKETVVEVVLIDASLNEVVIQNRKNFFYGKKNSYTASCIIPLPHKKNTIKLRFGFNVTTNMYYQKIISDSQDLSESSESTSKKRKINNGKFSLQFILWDTKQVMENRFDWVKLAVWSSPSFTLVSHIDQLHVNKIQNNTNVTPETLFPNTMPEKSKFPISVVGNFPQTSQPYNLLLKDGDKEIVFQMKTQTIKLISGLSPPLPSSSYTVYVIHGNTSYQCPTPLNVVRSEDWKKFVTTF
eukprot:TRINITY_DN3134_c0_g1_i1.p1 TRINITY_DN3134_c0_g1~~TRINITY_DN3134_c0_g1_i1.p1  ORF type:complete len:964 (-),score=263.02 TRINITY_DN3134_c0_g1_i1:17-2908(-)